MFMHKYTGRFEMVLYAKICGKEKYKFFNRDLIFEKIELVTLLGA